MDVGQKVNIFVHLYLVTHIIKGGFLGGSDSKKSACNAGNPDLIPGLERFPGEENGYPLQCSSLNNTMNRPGGQVRSVRSQSVGHD